MKYQYQWEIQPNTETDPHFVFTTTDSILDAARQFEEAWGRMSILYIRKVAVIEEIEYDEIDFREVI